MRSRAVDDRLDQWLRECRAAETISDTSLELTNFSSIFIDIQMSRFQYNLPPVVKRAGLDVDDKVSKKPNKRQKVEQVTNQNLKKEWKLRGNENWNTIFRGKAREGPILSVGCQGCHKFHNRGFCYEDCRFKASHKELNESDTKKFGDYCKILRGE